ncbi:MAG: response regulator transcription factor [Prolixibacteraceae bacterium]|jgi:two-component system, LytTR family, response regulator LytT|nr:response regulator transcription factor [Prolixibacteraceae bacterium]MBT6767096.1 response regulator transcription factor [Prolixibacteraceae bacterium]MBT6999673.1 response regulator transcription factor [Prolixibacteraceae bacterium]MBT7395010.1 response regulator transcription factor [Prolixibacteraceae bacterium]
MNVLIFEDEKHTATRLIKLLKKYDSKINVLDVIGSVKHGIDWYRNNPFPDLVFQDILLNDGNCFEIFEKVKVEIPVIFTTAYNEFALQSFKLNSIDYIVKPYDFQDIKKALDKFKNFRKMFIAPENELLKSIIQSKNPETKKRFLVKLGDKFSSVKSKDIAWFMYDEGVTFAFTFENTRFPVNYSVDQLSELLDADNFFQINRKYILNFESIRNIHTYFNSRLKLEIVPKPEEDLVVSRERVKDFKAWLDR